MKAIEMGDHGDTFLSRLHDQCSDSRVFRQSISNGHRRQQRFAAASYDRRKDGRADIRRKNDWGISVRESFEQRSDSGTCAAEQDGVGITKEFREGLLEPRA